MLCNGVVQVSGTIRGFLQELIREKVEREHDGEFLVVDVTTGSYEVDESDVAASDLGSGPRQEPNALLYFVRVGRPSAFRIGAWLSSAEPSAR